VSDVTISTQASVVVDTIDEALVAVVQQIDALGLSTPSVGIMPFTNWNGEVRFSVVVAGTPATSAHAEVTS
jgi:hypothetical protein